MKKINHLLADLEKMAENSPENITNLNELVISNIRGGKLEVTENGVCGGTNGNCHNGLCDGNGTSNGTCSNDNC
jgi:hypothetical protein